MLWFLCIHSDFPRGKKQGGQNETISYICMGQRLFLLHLWQTCPLMHSSQKGWQAGCSENQLHRTRTAHLYGEGQREGEHGCTWTSNSPLFSLPCLHLLLQLLICLLWIHCQKLVPIKGAAAELCVRCVSIGEHVQVLLVWQYLRSGDILC